MLLSDGAIRGLIHAGAIDIEPTPADRQFQPCSVDLTLGPEHRNDRYRGALLRAAKYLTIMSGEFVLATTMERVRVSDRVCGMVHGKSSWARKGLQVHAAGLVDPGFDGQITLELVNYHPRDMICIPVGASVCQITFQALDRACQRSYGHDELGSRYQNQSGPTPARTEEVVRG